MIPFCEVLIGHKNRMQTFGKISFPKQIATAAYFFMSRKTNQQKVNDLFVCAVYVLAKMARLRRAGSDEPCWVAAHLGPPRPFVELEIACFLSFSLSFSLPLSPPSLSLSATEYLGIQPFIKFHHSPYFPRLDWQRIGQFAVRPRDVTGFSCCSTGLMWSRR